MYKNKTFLAIIPARGGSKRLKNKNLFKVWNKPMIYWSVNAAKNSAFIKSIFVSSEDKNILNYAKKIKVNTIKRPKFLSRDNVFKMKAVQHAYKEICKKEKPSLIISLQANSPNVRTFDIDKCIEKLISNNLNEVISTDINYNQNGI